MYHSRNNFEGLMTGVSAFATIGAASLAAFVSYPIIKTAFVGYGLTGGLGIAAALVASYGIYRAVAAVVGVPLEVAYAQPAYVLDYKM